MELNLDVLLNEVPKSSSPELLNRLVLLEETPKSSSPPVLLNRVVRLEVNPLSRSSSSSDIKRLDNRVERRALLDMLLSSSMESPLDVRRVLPVSSLIDVLPDRRVDGKSSESRSADRVDVRYDDDDNEEGLSSPSPKQYF